MKRNWMVHVLRILAFFAAALAVLGVVTAHLWNHLLVALFGWPPIGFWQAVGLLILSRIFFGGWFRGARGQMHWRRRMMERWEKMTPEEREKFRAGWRGGCGPFSSTTAEKP